MAAEATETLKAGDIAPAFSLLAANVAGDFTLQAALQKGPVVLEFLRGTW